jgi:DNA-binding transcriptional ArsR family regulator
MGGAHGGESNGCGGTDRQIATLLLTDDPDDAGGVLDVAPGSTNLLVVSATRPAREVIEGWCRRIGGHPAAFGLITYTEFDRSATADATGRPSRTPLPGGDLTVTSMSDPSDLRRLGTAVTLYLDDWVDTDRETLVYLDALGPFVDAADAELAFQLLHLLVRSAAELDASVVVAADPSTTPDPTLDTFAPLFDRVVDTTAPLDEDELRDLLGNRRRRFVVRALLERSALELGPLATRLARWENDADEPTRSERDRAYTALASVHLPRLAEAGLVTFDRSAERVALADGDWSTHRLERYLTAPSDDDGR